MAVKALVFDCFGVLVHGSLGYLYTITPPHKHKELHDLNRSSDYGYISLDEYVQGIAELTDRTPEEIHEIIRAQHIRDERMIDYVREHKQTHKTALLSNVATSVMDELFTRSEQHELFDVVVLSSTVGMTKPSREIYEYTLRQLDVQPHEAVMIDDLAQNVEGARATGMYGVQFATPEQLTSELSRMLA